MGIRNLWVFLCMVTTVTGGQTPASINDLGWLSAVWHLEKNGRSVEEYWTKPAGGSMIGLSRTVAKGKMVEFEFLRIIEREGKLIYVAQPEGQPPTEFTATSVSVGAVTFENRQHDFPKRIIYRKIGENCVTASIDGGEGSKIIDFPYCRK